MENNILESALEALRNILTSRLNSFTAESPGKLSLNGEAKCLKSLSKYFPVEDISPEEGLVLILALVPHIRPHFIDQVIQDVIPTGGDLPQLGGIRGKHHRGFLPTGETALFLLSGEDLKFRFEIQKMFLSEHWFSKKQVLQLVANGSEEPSFSGQLILDQEYVEKITLGKASKPKFSIKFPASRITTKMDWDDLVLPLQTEHQIQEILIWLNHNKALMTELGMDRKLKPGYRALFHGPPGTGKTLTANLLGKFTLRDVYKVDLSTVVSKYVGETEKNLSNLFNKAENKDWILFFDEADALFGKRTQVQNAHDRYANQEVAFLLQCIEDHPGLVILASNFKSNIDEAFIRRFQSIIHFPMPKSNERLRLWQNAFPEKVKLSNDVNLKHFAQQYELSGADIMNIVQFVCLTALDKNILEISNDEIIAGIQREFIKSGKIC